MKLAKASCLIVQETPKEINNQGGNNMPFGDGTGPNGMGAMTGRAAGYCAGYSVPGYMNPIYGRGMGWRRGGFGGRGNRNWYYATGLPFWARAGYYPGYTAAPQYAAAQSPYGWPQPSKEDQLKALKSQADVMKQNLDDINATIQDLEKEEPEK